MSVNVSFTGRLVADPELRFTAAGVAVAGFRVAVSERVKNDQTGAWEDGKTTFLSCSAWRDMGENVAEYLAKGSLVIISGKLEQRDYEKDGQKRTTYEVSVTDIGQSMKWKDSGEKKPAASSSSGDEPPF